MTVSLAAPPAAVPAAAGPALPRRLRDWRGRHAGETMVVCGCGRSLAELPRPQRWTTVGVNDVGRLFDPTYLVVLNPRSQFRGDRFRHVETSRARALFTQLDLGVAHPCLVRFRLGRRGGTELDDADRLPYTRNSPYVAVCLAALMGARRIGLVGVDFTDHHFFADTGRHPLTRELAQIDREYGALAAALERQGVELVNLSRQSRLTRLPKVEPEAFLAGDTAPVPAPAAASATAVAPRPAPAAAPAPAPPSTPTSTAAPPRVFFVHYRFLYCGDVFQRGLEGAARSLGVPFAGAAADDPTLPQRVAAFAPDLLFVVHGRTFRQRWGRRLGAFGGVPRAVWLTDEPYEVDDTEATSALFDTVFVNDPSTLERHRNAHYLPMAFDPTLHRPVLRPASGEAPQCWDTGFAGSADPRRERLLDALAEAGLLSWVVGGPWRSRRLRALCRAARTAPEETAALYRQTRVVVNLFRSRHHYNRRGVAPWSLNPRVYEALGCGAAVVCEERPELAEVFPALPRFADTGGLVAAVGDLLAGEERRRQLLEACRRELPRHTYAERLERALELALGAANHPQPGHSQPSHCQETPMPVSAPRRRRAAAPPPIHRLEHRGPVVPGRITVVVPVFDCAPRFLDRALASIRAQADPGDLELVVVDDGSAPEYRVAETARRHAPDHLICLPRNLGACAARNVGWLSGQGEATLFFDADDVLEPSAVRVMRDTLERHPEAALCYSDFTVDGARFAAGPFDLDTLRRRNRVAIASLVRTREFVGFDERVPRGMDWDAWLRMLKLGKQGVKAPGVLFHVTTAREGRISTTVPWSRLQQTMRRHHPDLRPAPRGRAAARPEIRAAARRKLPPRQTAPRGNAPAHPAPERTAPERTVVTAVVVYQDSQPWFEVLLESLLRRRFTADPQRVHLRVLLVENPCTDESPRLARAFCERFGNNAAVIPSRLRRSRRGGGANHAHGLAVGLRHVKPDSEWTLFLDADVVLLEDGWLDHLLALGADVAGPPAFAHLADYSVPHAHPSLLLFRTRLGLPPSWSGGFAPRRDPAGGGVLDTAIAFTMALGRRPGVRLVQLPQERRVAGALEYYRIGDLALHLRGVSNLPARPARYGAKRELLALPEVAALLTTAGHTPRAKL